MIAMADYRAYIRVPGIDIEGDAANELGDALNRHHGKLGPVLGGTREGIEVIVSLDRPTKSEAVTTMVAVVADSMIRVGLGDHYPTSIELEPVDERELEPA